jgi:hypothetical protein
LGDLVNYGPEPKAVIDFVRDRVSVVVRGNHDHSIGYDEDPRCSPRYRQMAETTRKYTACVVSEDQKQFLRLLPLNLQSNGTTHASTCVMLSRRIRCMAIVRKIRTSGAMTWLGFSGRRARGAHSYSVPAHDRQLPAVKSGQSRTAKDGQAGCVLCGLGQWAISAEIRCLPRPRNDHKG